ncbi:DUF3152 domain-containing protein [Amycolatopsis regifaucium]|uniref:DUF3152 domain-containing protein n=1 Tax=Amycolatopsis regifaucium TaxID=546365 RepID=A0A154MDV7_9PSEU|nr:DUF3152 domain-containing protein [Amycolatopsis regifaucium]KZB82410.1 hypothetical protein AVL48_10895 [Amycolatopsis regifaucium]OKA10193.1 hypothetical protein ATP06_0204655 [Amycolatopsis regifaucium]SFG92018.1 Protein of unknown function [Amycolatopsis regifaucium]
MDRVKQDAQGEGRRSQYSAAARRSSRPQPRTSDVPRTGQYRPTPPPSQRLDEDRYRPGTRRTSAQPLSASWKPHEPAAKAGDRKAKGKSGGIGQFAKTYGWRVYALPILVVITALVVFNTATGPPEPIASDGTSLAAADGSAGNGGEPGAGVDGGGDVLPENPAKPVDLKIPTADLPKGANFTESGKGTYHVVPGSGPKVGTGQLFTYTVEVEDGIDPASYAGDDSFANAVVDTLSSPQSWTWDGKKALQRVDASYPNPSFRVSLTTPNTTHRADVCMFQITYETSCYRASFDKRVVINLARWVRGAMAFQGDMTGYRQYAINHEVGHALGGKHVGCPVDGGIAPVMMQQTFGVSNNFVAQLNDLPGGDRGKVPADGKVCKPGSWPNPTP